MALRASIGCMLLVAASCGYPPPELPPDAAPPELPLDAAPPTFAQEAYVKASNTNANDMFGSSVALSADGMTLAVGAVSEDSTATGVGGNQALNNGFDSGAVYLFARTDVVSPWIQQAYVKASNTGVNAEFGTHVALSADGSTLAVSAPGESSDARGVNPSNPMTGAIHSGAVYVFTREDGTWTQQAFIKASNTGGDDQFGSSLALSADGSTLAIGASLEDSPGTGVDGTQTGESAAASGAVYVFTRISTTWSQQAYIKASDSRQFINFGSSVSLADDGSTLAAGTGASGTVYIFTRSVTTWTQRAFIEASNAEPGDQFGVSVALSGDGSTLAVGAQREDSAATGVDGNEADNSAPQSGAVYVFTGAGATWTQRAYIKASNADANDQFGSRLALSSDGSTLAIGAQLESSAATGLGGDPADNSATQSGAVYVFESTGPTWMQQYYVKASNTDIGDQFGSSVALSIDGSTLAVGAFGEASTATGVNGDQGDDSAMTSGAVYVFQ